MLGNRVFQFSVFGAAALAALGWGAHYWLTVPRKAVPHELAQQALHAPTPAVREAAAIELSRCGKEAGDLMRQVFREGKTPETRAAAAQGLAAIGDIDMVGELIDAMEDESPMVRGRAATAVSRIVGLGVDFHANDPAEKRQKAIALYRKFWEKAKLPNSKFRQRMAHPELARQSAEQALAEHRKRQADASK